MKDLSGLEVLSKFIHELPITMALIDEEGRIQECTKTWKEEFKDIEYVHETKYINRPELEKAIKLTLKTGDAFVMGEDEIHSISYKWKLKTFGESQIYVQWVTILTGREYRLQRLREMANKVADIGYWEVNLDNDEIFWSSVTKKIHGVPEDFKPNMVNALAFYTEEDTVLLNHAMEKAINDDVPYNIDLVITNLQGKQVNVNARGKADYWKGKPVRLVGTFQDITERTRRKELLGRAKERYEKVLNNALVGFVIMNLETNKIVSVNRPILKMFEAKIDELVGKGLIEFVSEEDKEPLINDFYKLLHGEKAAFERRIELRTLKGNTITADCYLYINTNEAEEATELVVQISDITQLVKTTRENDIYVDMLTRQNDRLVNFAHIVSHNLRSHTSNISMLLGLMEFEEDKDEIHTQLMMLKKASNMLSETIQHLNEVIAIDIDTKEKERLNLKEHIDKSIEASQGLITGKEIQVNNAVAADVEVDAVPAYLDSIVLNMLTNAIKYSSKERDSYVNFKAHKEAGSTMLVVEDNGLGIDMAKYGYKIFGMYKTFHDNKESRGLGLYMTKRQIEIMGGTINVESQVGKGTTFKIEFI